MDVATILMIATCKYISFAFCYSDGFKDKKELFLGINNKLIIILQIKMKKKLRKCPVIWNIVLIFIFLVQQFMVQPTILLNTKISLKRKEFINNFPMVTLLA